MPQNKREPKRVKSFRLSWLSFDLLHRITTKTGMSEGQVVELAIGEYFHKHREFWPDEKKPEINS